MLQAVNSVEVRPRIGGQITAIHFTDGSQVRKGQALFTIDPRPYAAEVTRAKGALASAQSAQVRAAQDMARAKVLIKSKAISQSEYETRVSALQQAQGNLESAQGALKVAELNLAYTNVSAPIAGKISRAEITVGNLVDGGGSAPLLASIVDLSPIYASFDVDEKTFLATIQGVPAAKLKTIPVEVGLGNETGTALKAAIHSFDNQITPSSGTIRVRALLTNKDETLVPGLYARVRLGTPDPQMVTLINATAVGTDQDKKFVMVVGEGGKAEYRPVTLAGVAEGLQIVTSGLKPDEQIIVNGLQRVRPDAPITGTPVDMLTLAPLNPPAAAVAPDAAPTAPAEAPAN
jgi:multidrug efflux system membrane fusion protein